MKKILFSLVVLGLIASNVFAMNSGTKSVTTAGTPEALSTDSNRVNIIYITANEDNTGYIYVGDSTVDASANTGNVLAAGDIIIYEYERLNQIYLDSTVNGEGVGFTYR